jgi:hypothetical protein
VLERAAAIGVSAACRDASISQSLFYWWRQRFQRYGPDGVNPRRRRAPPRPAPQLPPAVERRVLAGSDRRGALGRPTAGGLRAAAVAAAYRGQHATAVQFYNPTGLITATVFKGEGQPRSSPVPSAWLDDSCTTVAA